MNDCKLFSITISLLKSKENRLRYAKFQNEGLTDKPFKGRCFKKPLGQTNDKIEFLKCYNGKIFVKYSLKKKGLRK